MWNKLFPKTVENKYTGHVLGLILLGFYVFKSFLAGSIHMFAPDGGAQSIGSIALDQFTEGGANSVITMFGAWGMEQFVLGLIALVILLRYKGLISMMAMAYVLEYAGRMAIPFFTPGVFSIHTPPGHAADAVLVPLAVLMLILTLYRPKKKREDKIRMLMKGKSIPTKAVNN